MKKGKSRVINTNFWKDDLILDKFTSEDKVFWMYLLTSEEVNNLGAYKILMNKTILETGYSKDTINNILKRFRDYHNIIMYDEETMEIMIKNFYKYNWTTSPTFKTSVIKAFELIKSESIKKELKTLIGAYFEDKEYKDLKVDDEIPFALDKNSEFIQAVIDIYNNVFGGELTYKNKTTNGMILARKEKDNATIKDFETMMIYKKREWEGTEYAKYLIPSTLFSPSKFSGYLQQAKMDNGMVSKKKEKEILKEMAENREKKLRESLGI